ncbi:MAG: phosphoenolpyruvate--protein phosphotransferase [Steroidobacteraceae bacterium]
MTERVLRAPLRGWSTPLEEVPDPVFAGRMLGDGVAIDPLDGTLFAPCDGQVAVLPATRHAITLRTAAGEDILMHIGIDTVALGGEGFEACVAAGQTVRSGEPLIRFDLDLLTRRVPSVLTPVLVLGSPAPLLTRRMQSCAVDVGDLLLEWAAPHGAHTEARPTLHDEGALARTVRVALEHGIHARPAAQVAAALKGLRAQVQVHFQGRSADARSATGLMTLGVRRDDSVEVRAGGADADAALEALAALLSRPEPRAVARPPTAVTVPSAPIGVGGALRGVVASRGLAVGPAALLRRQEIAVVESGAGIDAEGAALRRACAEVQASLERSLEGARGPTAEILTAHLALIEDPALRDRARALIEQGKSAAFAWRAVIRQSIAALRALEDGRMAERADDLIDLEQQVLLVLTGQTAAVPSVAPGSILIAHELLPSQLVGLEAGTLGGICLAAGGATSHVSILAAAAGIPALVALGATLEHIPPGTTLVLDAERGELLVDPGATALETARRHIARDAERRTRERMAAQRECRLADGTRIEVLANLGSLADAHLAVRNGAEGCGLLRTEFLFLERQTAPDEAEQRAEYQRIATALAGRPLTVRTLDIGGDKPIPYLPLPVEENPALGLRGIRTSLWREELLDEQLRAVLAVEPPGQCRVLLPMITDVTEIRIVRTHIEEACRRIGRTAPVELGVMIETPASALMADSLAGEVDFFSIGTNDLTQYTLAMDRGHAYLAARLDGLHPAVLRLIARTAEAAHAQRRRTAVCGGLASDPLAVPILVGLGVHELSCVPAMIPQIKALLATLTLEQCRERAVLALAQESAEAVRMRCSDSDEASGEPVSARR